MPQLSPHLLPPLHQATSRALGLSGSQCLAPHVVWLPPDLTLQRHALVPGMQEDWQGCQNGVRQVVDIDKRAEYFSPGSAAEETRVELLPAPGLGRQEKAWPPESSVFSRGESCQGPMPAEVFGDTLC